MKSDRASGPTSQRMRRLFTLFCASLLSNPALFAQLNRIDSENFRIVYPGRAFSYVVPHIGACAVNALRFYQNLYQYSPSEKITVFLEDFSDFGHGGANTVPSNFINLGIAPFSYVYDTVPAIDRMYWMANHEMVHVVTMDQSCGADNFWRKFFRGKVNPNAEQPLTILYNYLSSPRWNAPRWYHEGIAVFLETWMAGGLGRAMGAYDEMVFRSKVRDDGHFYSIIGLESEGTTIDFQVGVNSYLYGTRFMSYLAYIHGPEKLLEWTSRRPGSKGSFSAQFKNVYGASLDEEWSRWIEWERGWQNDNLDRIRKNPTTRFKQISDIALGSVSKPFYSAAARKLYVGIRYPGQLAQIAAIDIDTGKMTKVTNVEGPALFYVTSLARDPSNGLLFYTTDNYGWRDLHVVNVDTGESRRLIKDLRVGDLAFNPADRSLWGVRHFNGISTLVRIPAPYVEWDQIHSWPYGQDIYDIDISPDGKLLTAALAEVDGGQSLISMHVDQLIAGESSFETVFDFENSSPSNFMFSEDGKSLYGTSYYSGVSNVFRYDLQRKEMEIISNAETGFFRPAVISDQSLLVFRYTGRGFVPVIIPNEVQLSVGAIRFLGNEIVKKHPVVKEWKVDAPSKIQFDQLKVSEGEYSSFKSIRFNSLYPIVEGYKDDTAIGVRFDFSDATNLSGFDLSLSYSPTSELPSEERFHFALNLHHWDWEIRATYNRADFYDLFGPTKRSRKGYSLGLGYNKTLWYDEPKKLNFGFDITGYGDMDTLPFYQNIEAPSDKLLSTKVSLEYEFVEKSLGAVDEEKGLKWRVISGLDFTNSDEFPIVLGTIDFGVPLRIDHSSIWLRSAAGHSFGDPEDPFSNFYFGGFGNNWVDHLTEKRYREFYSFPGMDLNEVGGQNFGKALLEWNIPPVRFRNWGRQNLYMNWLRPALFSSALVTNIDNSAMRRTLFNLGGQVDFRFVLFSNLESTISIGYGVAFENGEKPSHEFMASLKIL